MTKLRRIVLALLAALAFAAAGYAGVHRLYDTGHLTVDVGDSDGHGPDRDTPEWRDAAERTTASRSRWAGTFCFVVAFGVLRPWAKRPEPAGPS